jgi:hypothetical protein
VSGEGVKVRMVTTGCLPGTLMAPRPDRRVTVPFDLAALLAAHQGECFVAAITRALQR